MKPKIISETPISAAKVKSELEKIKKRDSELSYRANKTLEYLQQVIKLSEKKTKELETDLTKLEIPRLKEQHVQKLISILPTTQQDVKVVLQGYTLTITADNTKKISETIKKYA